MTERERDRTFGPAVLAGLGGCVLAAVASNRTWATGRGSAAGVQVSIAMSGSEAVPLALALALLALASWGVVLVFRGRARRWLAAVGAVAATAGVVTVAVGREAARTLAEQALDDRGASGEVPTSITVWWYIALLAFVVAGAASAVAAWRAPRWPSLSRRYDAPSARTATAVSETDMWRAMDEGHDPTS